MDIFKGPKTRGLWPHLAVTTSLLVSCSFTPSNPPPSDMVDGGEDIGLEDTMVDAGRLDTGMNDADVDGGMPNGTCGDGIINGQPPETCDDGNTTPDDGCEANCGVITPGFQCEVVDDVPASVCERSPVLSVTSTTVREGDVALVRVQLSAPTERLTVSFMWQTVDNGTAETNDYAAVQPTMVTILPGEQEAVLAIQTMPDALREQPEAFTVQIQNAQGAISNDLMATVTIEDDRTPSENGLIARYYMTDGDDGASPVVLTDATGNLDLNVSADNNNPTTRVGNEGVSLAWAATNNDGVASMELRNTEVLRELDRSTQFTLEVVLSARDFANGSILWGVTRNGPGRSTELNALVSVDGEGEQEACLRLSNSFNKCWEDVQILNARRVVTWVFDASRSGQQVVMYIDGVAESAPDGGGRLDSIDIPNNQSMLVGNREEGGRAIRGEMGYLSIYAQALSADEVLRNATLLLDDDDAP